MSKDSEQLHDPNKFRIHRQRGSINFWQKNREQLLHVYTHAFPQTEDEKELKDIHRRLEYEFSSSHTVVFLLIKASKIVGFTTYFGAWFENDQKKKEKRALKLNEAEYIAMQKHAMQVGFTAILPEEQDKGGWSLLMQSLETEVNESPEYTSMVRYVTTTNEYAEKVENRYVGNILYKTDTIGDFGPQKYLRIKIVRD